MKHKLLHPSRWGVALLLAVCTVACDTESGLPDTPPEGGDVPVGFSVGVGAPAATRAGGELTTANLTSMGVFAYYTGQSGWTTANTPNFMYNQRVTRTGSSAPWTYTPVKYWPNTAGDKISFFAYAPHTSDMTGLTVKSGTGAGTAGYPQLYYDLPVDASLQKDLLAATALTNRTKSTSSAAFAMKHVLTRVLVNARCSDAIRVTKVKVNSIQAGYGTLTWNSGGNPVWSSFTSVMDSEYSTATDVPANAANATQIAEYFLYPKTATGKLEVTFTIGGNSETKSVDIPASPAWEMGKTIAYTLNIEVGSEVTLTVKAWDTNSANNGTMGEEVPTTGYPFMKNGIIYESATKSYYVGAIRSDFGGGNGGGYYNWHETIDLCRSKYSTYPYSSSEWRLPSGSELKNIGKFSLGGNEYIWAFEQASATEGTLYRLYASGDSNDGANYGKTDYRSRVLCVRDLGDLTYPTVRQISNDLLIVHESAGKSFYVGPTVSDGRYSGGNGGGYYNWHECHRICNEEYSASPFAAGQWRLPTVSEIDAMRPYGIRVNTWIYASEEANATQAWLTKVEKEVWKTAYGKTDYRSVILCVRDY